jgi:hypothetical protein
MLSEKRRIGYLRLKASDAVVNAKEPPKWSLLRRDTLAEGKPFSGYLLYKLVVGPSTEVGAFTRGAMQTPHTKKYQLRANIYQGRGLSAADDNASSDPYCVIHLAGSVGRTKVQPETCSPLWYEALHFDVELPDPLHLAPHVNVLVYDKDQFSADDLLGLFSVPLTELVQQPNPVPTWYPLYDREENFGKKSLGEVLASFQLLAAEQADATPVQEITPQTKDAVVGVSVVGLRQLLPFASLPIQNAYVEFRCGSATPVRTKPSKKPNGANPNFLEEVEMKVKLPINAMFCPDVDVKVFDHRVIHRPLIGSTTVKIDKLLPWTGQDEVAEKIPEPTDALLNMEIPPSIPENTQTPAVSLSSAVIDPPSSSSSSSNEPPQATEKIDIVVEVPPVSPPVEENTGGGSLVDFGDIPLLGRKAKADVKIELPGILAI